MEDFLQSATLQVIHAGTSGCSFSEIADIKQFLDQPSSLGFSEGERIAIFRALEGGFKTTCNDYFFLLITHGRPISSAWYAVSRRTPEVAVVGWVFTDPEWRQRGLSTFLLQTLCEHFTSRGGRAIYLGTENPSARRIYQKVGFTEYNGDVMQRLSEYESEREFENRIFGAGQKVHIRAAEWGDVALATALYTNPFPWIVRDFTERIILWPSGRLNRCVSMFDALMLRSELPGNSMHVLENAGGYLVACVSLISSPSGKEHLLEFLAHPSYSREAKEFLHEVAESRIGLICYAAEEDQTKLEILRSLNFQEARATPPAAGLVILHKSSR